MSERKNIDRLFQEKFKDFEAQPATDLWSGIEARLEEKKDRRIIPFWWKLSGVAAIFLIGFLLGEMVFNHDSVPTNGVVIDNQSRSSEGKETQKNPEKSGMNGISPEINPNDAVTNNENSNDIPSKWNKTAVASDSKTNPNAFDSKSKSNEATVVNELKTNSRKSTEKSNSSAKINQTESIIAQGKSGRNRNGKEKIQSGKNTHLTNESISDKDQNPIAVQDENKTATDSNPLAQNADEINRSKENASPLAINKDINLEALKGENNSKITSQETEKKANDSLKKNPVATNELEELLKEKEKKSKQQESRLNRWQLTSNVAPIFLGSASNGSPIDSTLTSNSKSYNTSVGFGLGVSYAVNKKLSVRTGVNKFNINYNTNNIVYFAGIEARTLRNVNTAAAATRIHIENENTTTPSVSEIGLLPFEASIVQKNKGYLNQEMGYIEMPVEMTYAVVDKRFGFKIIGGFSTLLLNDNAIHVVSDNRSTYLGEANNLNDIHFSTNIGLGLKYGFMKSFEFNVEPTFKYQINTFSSGAGNFKPYVFGIYSGISYKF